MRPTTTARTIAIAAAPPLAPAPAPAPFSGHRASALGAAAACWGVGAHLALVAAAAVMLLRGARRAFAEGGASPESWLASAACVAALCYVQGYRGFQRRFSPRLVARAAHLARHPRPLHALAAPLHVCGLVYATPRRRAATALLFAAMPLLAAGVGLVPPALHGAVDLGVAAGLAWGFASIALLSARAAAARPPACPLDLPPGAPR